MKTIKHYYMGKRLKDIYPYATKFQVFKYKVRKFFRGLIFWSVIIGAIILSVRIFFPKIEYSIVEKQVIIDNLAVKREELKGKLVADLILGENGVAVKYDPPKGKYKCPEDVVSFGKYQFKVCTVIGYYKSLYGKTITKKEAILIALDDNKAGELAQDMIFKEKGGIENWFNTANKYKLREQLAVINALQ